MSDDAQPDLSKYGVVSSPAPDLSKYGVVQGDTSKAQMPATDTPGGKLQNYLTQHFPNVAHYLGVSAPTPADEAEFQRNEQDHAQFVKDHPILHEVTKAVLNDPTVAPNILSAGAVPPGLIRQGAGLVKNAVQATAEMGGAEFAQSPLGKLLLPYRWRMAVEVADELAKKSPTGGPELDAMAQRLGFKDFASSGKDGQAAITQMVQGGATKIPPPSGEIAPLSERMAAQPAAAPPRTIQQELEAYLSSGRQEVGIAPANAPAAPESPGLRSPIRPPLAKPEASAEVPRGTSEPAVSTESPAATRGIAIMPVRNTSGGEVLAKALVDDGITADQAKAMDPKHIRMYGDFTPGDITRAIKIMDTVEGMKNVSPAMLERLKATGATKAAIDLAREMGK